MSASDYAAWYAALLATLIAVWDFIKWKQSGPSITGEAWAARETFGIPATEGKLVAFAKLTNRGDAPTTLTSWGMYSFPNTGRLNRKNREAAFVVLGGLGGVGTIPCKLSPGDTWTGIMEQNSKVDKMLAEGRVFFGFGFSHADKEVMVQLKKER